MRRWYILATVAVLFLVAILRRGENCAGCQERKAKLKSFLQGE